mmetsp:Transcript_75287/g.133097  ORF Transcript_75287/g.133097 Transcript_75287/m.133097 type:complete len:94 (-) Transcript_75287:1595-1876(-)
MPLHPSTPLQACNQIHSMDAPILAKRTMDHTTLIGTLTNSTLSAVSVTQVLTPPHWEMVQSALSIRLSVAQSGRRYCTPRDRVCSVDKMTTEH